MWTEIEGLQRRGFSVRCYGNVLDALASFGKEMPSAAVIGPLAPHSANALLMEDLDLYGVPFVRILPASREVGQMRSASLRENPLHRNLPQVRSDAPAHR
ncbi:MAG: hypothetical protein DI555_23775 [Novosphingobium pentaromativorans]|uniref:Uncharacterized protein n=1 Tax=Novosphingobium pentaromativorans TaxID=205844 RepID=A0A2W5N7X6_9SPHN|nr:hypothetical protein [Novosphingobium panipatense]PZQ49571.1 MAG: hypothetical protein DI555_23775 [Novosphingobium pentaromativorans]